MLEGAIFRKGTLLIPTGPHDHLHVVMNDPVHYPPKDGEAVLVVCFCSHTNALQDSACLLEPGDHEFVKWATYVDYSRAELKLANNLGRLAESNVIRVLTPVSDALYERIRLGFRESRRTPRKIITFMDYIGI